MHDPDNPYADLFDEELILTLSDWYHDEMPGLIAKFLSVTNPTGAEPGKILFHHFFSRPAHPTSPPVRPHE